MGTQLVLEDLSFNVYAGERVGLVGSNGSGKTTILKLIAGILPLKRYPGSWSKGYDNGMIAVPKEARLAYLDQIPEYPSELSVKGILLKAFDEAIAIELSMRALETKMAQPELSPDELERLMDQYHRLQLSFESLGGYEMQEKYSKICAGLGFSDVFVEKSFGMLSGGERTRVELGKILMDKPDILLLDEPTNHLDTHATEWLEQYLANYPGIVIVVSHDRYFLDRAINKIIEIEDMKAQVFKGNYTEYVRQKDAQVSVLLDQFKEQQKQIKQMESAIKQLRDWAMRSDNNKFFQRAASIQIKLDKMAKIKKPMLEKQHMQLDLQVQSRSGKEVVRISDLEMGFGSQILFKGAQLLVRYGERVALIGPNGSGKSTLFQLLLGQAVPQKGVAELGQGVLTAYLPQEVQFDNEGECALECFRSQVIMNEGQARSYLAKFMFFGSRVFTAVNRLSGGERIRLKLAIMLTEDINLLLLDEPTNHLDIESIEALEAALDDYKGTLLFISHDRYFINEIAQRVVAIENLQLGDYPGTYDSYKEVINKRPLKESNESTRVENTATSRRQKEKPIKTRDFEAEIHLLEARISEIDDAMHMHGTDYLKLQELQEHRKEASQALNTLWSEWSQETTS